MNKDDTVSAVCKDVKIRKELAEKVVDSVLNYIKKNIQHTKDQPNADASNSLEKKEGEKD